MLNALVTLPFLFALAFAGWAAWQTYAQNSAKVMAALQGRSVLADTALSTRPVTVRYAPRQVPARTLVRTSAQWRAAA